MHNYVYENGTCKSHLVFYDNTLYTLNQSPKNKYFSCLVYKLKIDMRASDIMAKLYSNFLFAFRALKEKLEIFRA